MTKIKRIFNNLLALFSDIPLGLILFSILIVPIGILTLLLLMATVLFSAIVITVVFIVIVIITSIMFFFGV